MWLIENDGPVFNGKRKWLRPGSKYLFGRTGVDVGGFAIPNKTISRKHLTIEIGETTAEDAARPDTRSKLTVEDLKTKIGTTVNGEQIKGTVRDLDGADVFEIKLAHYEDLFRITWVPCFLSFSFTTKETKSSPLVKLCDTFGPLDMKVNADYQSGTTHVVATKRNTSKGLQALINGKYIVDHVYVEAIVTACQSEDGTPAALETDYDGNWPSPSDYLPPKGAEATNRLDAAYAPNADRKDIFDGYTFIFYNRTQFDNLLAPITNGKGKALFREVDPDSASVDDFVGFVKNAAGEKGLGSFDDGSEGRGVVVVRFIPSKGATIEWYESFVREVSLRLDHRMIEQSEFLDAILNNDASVLRRPLEVEQSTAPPSTFGQSDIPQSTPQASLMAPPPDNATRAPESSASTSHAMQGDPGPHLTNPESPSHLAPAAPLKRGRSRRIITSRFKGFDDFDMTDPVPDVSQISSLAPADHEASLFVSQLSQMEDNFVSRTNHKRTLSPMIEDSEEDVMETLAPAASRLKRQKLAADIERRGRGESTPPPIAMEIKSEPTSVKKKKAKPAVDIIEYTRQQREKAEELARQERESLAQAMDGMDIDAIRKLAVIEEMPITRSNPRKSRTDDADDRSRWDDAWNGRKNFKKFRRRGEEGGRRGHKVIVPLEEVKRKDFGIGDEYWLEGGTATSESQSRIEPQSKSGRSGKDTPQASDTRTESSSRPLEHRSQAYEADNDIQIIASDPEDSNPETDLPSVADVVQATPASVSQRSQRSSTRTSTAQGTRQSTQASKRAAEEALSKPAAPKKAKTMFAPRASDSQRGRGQASAESSAAASAPRVTRTLPLAEDEEDSDDGLGFKFGRRQKRR